MGLNFVVITTDHVTCIPVATNKIEIQSDANFPALYRIEYCVSQKLYVKREDFVLAYIEPEVDDE